MNAHAPTPRIDPMAIPLPHIDAAIAALVALRLRPSRDNYAWYRALKTFDVIEGCDALLEAIQNMESDLGLAATECLACGSDSCGCDAEYEDHSAWGLTTRAAGGGHWA